LKCDLNRLKIVKPILVILLLAHFFPVQAARAETPGAGSILQQMPAARSSSEIELQMEQGDITQLPSFAPFMVDYIQIKGNTLFDTVTLHALVMDEQGKSLTFAKLVELAGRITDYYHSHGYYMAKAIVPAQQIQNGQAVIQVIEERYGKIILNNLSSADDSLLQDTLSSIQSGQAIELSELDRSLFLLSDIPGVTANSSWKKSDAAGTSDLVVDVPPSRILTGYASLDNYGNSYNGKTRAYGNVNIINPLNHGDIMSASILSSGSGMSYGRLGYEYVLNGSGTRMGASYSKLHYELSDIYAYLNEHGTAQVVSFWIKHPLSRSRDVNSYAEIQYDQKQLQDHVDLTNVRTDRHLSNLTVYLFGNSRDKVMSGGTTTWNTGLTFGEVGFDDANAKKADLTSAVTQAGFFKWTMFLTRLQNLGPKNSLYLVFSNQWASVNLETSEKMVAGGPYTVRAYDMAVLLGDNGYLFTAEIRHDLDQVAEGKLQLVGFIDTQHLTFYNNAWAAWTNDATLSGAGVGLNWSGPRKWSIKTFIAKPIGSIPDQLLANTASKRAWFEIAKEF